MWLCFVIESPYPFNDPEHTQHFIISIAEQMIELGEENKEMRSKLQIHDRELRKVTTTMEKLHDENKLLSKNMEQLHDENQLLSQNMEKLHDENTLLSKDMEQLNDENKLLSKNMEKLYEENKLLSKNNQFLSEAVIKIDAENKHLSTQVKNLAKENEKLTDKIKDQAKDISALNKNVTKPQNGIMKEQSSRPPKALVLEEIGDNISKRIVLHSDTDILHLVTTHGTEIKKLQTDVAALKINMPKGESGSTYVRWGRDNCSGNGTQLVYSGYAAGSDFRDSGAAANYICLSPDPLWGHYSDAQDSDAKVMGVEYELAGAAHGDTTAFFHKSLHDDDAPCSVCRSPRPTVIMIPGRNQCYKGWNLEYKGYLVAGYYGRDASSEYVCLDENPNVIPGGHNDQNGALFYMVEGRCGSLLCPPYVDGRELTCVVCSK